MQLLQIVNEGLAGGVLRVALELTKHLNILGHKTVLVIGFRDSNAEKMFGNGHGFVHAKYNFSLPSFLAKYLGGFTREVVGQIGKVKAPPNFKPEWIICHNLTPFYDAYSLSQKLGSKLAVIIHNPTYPPSLMGYASTLMNIRSSPFLERARACLEKADLILAIHGYNVKMVRKLYGVGAEKILLGCESIDMIPPVRGDFILIASRLSLGKQIHELARAISLADRTAKVIFAGSTHHTTGKVVKLISKIALAKYNIVTNVPEPLFRKLFLRSRVVVYGLSETDFMMPASHGAPIICLRIKYALDVFTDGIHGYIIESRKGGIPVEEYAERIADLLADERKAWKMGSEAWELCRKAHTWYHRAKELIQILEGSY